jgi:hypothetical protein
MENLTRCPVSGASPGILSIDPKAWIVQPVVSEVRTEARHSQVECLPDQRHWNLHVSKDVLRHGAEQQMRHSGPAVGTHEDLSVFFP